MAKITENVTSYLQLAMKLSGPSICLSRFFLVFYNVAYLNSFWNYFVYNSGWQRVHRLIIAKIHSQKAILSLLLLLLLLPLQTYSLISALIIEKASTPSTIYKLPTRWCPSFSNKKVISYIDLYVQFFYTGTHKHIYPNNFNHAQTQKCQYVTHIHQFNNCWTYASYIS